MVAIRRWWFFRFRGLTLADNNFDLHALSWRDWDIVSRGALNQSIESSTNGDFRRVLLGSINNPQLRPADSYLVVSRVVPEIHSLISAEEIALQRARSIAALIAICHIASGTPAVGCGLTQDVNDNMYDSLRFDDPGWDLRLAQPGRVTYPTPGHASTRDEIAAMLADQEFVQLRDAIVGSRLLGTNMRRKITSSALRLASGIWSNEAESLLLGAFTSIEMFLGEGGHDRMSTRVRTLLGNQLSDRLLLDDVVKARHNYVHRGQSVTPQMGLTAIALGIVVLLTYCRLAVSLNESVRQAGLIDILLDLQSRNPPLAARQMADLFRNADLAQFRPAREIQFLNPPISGQVTMPLNNS